MVEYCYSKHIKTAEGLLRKDSKEDWVNLYNTYSSGSSITTLSRRYKISETTIKKYFHKFGLSTLSHSEAAKKAFSNVKHIKAKKGKISIEDSEEWKEIHSKYNAGTSLTQLKEEYGLGSDTLKKYFKKFNLSLVEKQEYIKTALGMLHKDSLDDWKPLCDKYLLGKSMVELAKEYKLATSTISSQLKKFNCIDKPRVKSHKIRTLKGILDSNNRSDWVDMYKKYHEGMSLGYLAKEYGTSAALISKYFKKFGFEMKGWSETISLAKRYLDTKVGVFDRRNPEHWKPLYEKYLYNFTLLCLEKEYGISSNAIKKAFIYHGWELKPAGGSLKDKNERKAIIKTRVGEFLNCRETWQTLHDEYLEGKPLYKIAEDIGIRTEIIKSNFKKYKMKIFNKEELAERHTKVTRNRHGNTILTRLNELGFSLKGSYKGMVRLDKINKRTLYTKYEIVHNECGNTFTRTLHASEDISCPYCSNNYLSKKETKLKLIVQKYVDATNLIENTRRVIHPMELDLYLPDNKVAFEYNGNYWHSTIQNGMYKNYHRKKTDKCLEKGVKLYHVWERCNIEIVESKIKQLLGKVENRYFARKLTLREVSISERREFFDLNHLDGDVNASFALGLYNGSELLTCISFRKHKEGMEIARLATKVNCSVVGGFSKLLKHSIIKVKEDFPNINKVVTYCDRDWTPDYRDSVYFKNGFNFIKDSGCMLKYYNSVKGIIHSREKYQKHKLEKLFPEFYNSSLTADEILYKAKIYPLYNSGNFKYELEIK